MEEHVKHSSIIAQFEEERNKRKYEKIGIERS